MQFITALLTAILIVEWITKGINHWLPGRVVHKNMGLVDGVYRLMRIVAAPLIFCSLSMLRFNIGAILVGWILYLWAFLIKKTTWNLVYRVK